MNSRPASPPGLGPTPVPGEGVFFRVWAPRVKRVAVRQVSGKGMTVELSPEENGYFAGLVPGMTAGALYTYLLDGTLERPDPASRCQPQGVHGPSQVPNPFAHAWQDGDWQGIELTEMIIYELHVGTFSPAGTFAGVAERLDYLRGLGITVVELMPVAQFPGGRNWGYDGVYPFAVQSSYGGADGLKGLVDACHRQGLAVILDVVYNHLGPEGNYLHAFGPYFTDRYQTPWGEAVNFDGPGSDGVREYMVADARLWIAEFHIDGLRLDAVHTIFDFSVRHILDEIGGAVHELAQALGRRAYVIAESDLPLLFMGEEYGETAPFHYFVSHGDNALIAAVRQGRKAEFAAFG